MINDSRRKAILIVEDGEEEARRAIKALRGLDDDFSVLIAKRPTAGDAVSPPEGGSPYPFGAVGVAEAGDNPRQQRPQKEVSAPFFKPPQPRAAEKRARKKRTRAKTTARRSRRGF